ncbi:nitrate/nitrite transporter NrtS [Ruegeria sp. HKCCD8929]|uniref:nitrate/nitrite transporter NrtS n=1 Tax=Ruegeria sp. HKCCD8929 TaxID=2683006 RepID=UPI001489F583|nr:nitrate/nitrite transporter NrtS [Ruegeria sp. HKCCD8929]
MSGPIGPGFFEIALRPSVVKRASRVALVVGIVLGLLNHGDAILSGAVTNGQLAKICLTFLVPYSVSTYSSVLAIRERDQELGS